MSHTLQGDVPYCIDRCPMLYHAVIVPSHIARGLMCEETMTKNIG